MIQLIVGGKELELDRKVRYRLELKMPLPGGDIEYSSTPFFDLPFTDFNREALNTSQVLSFWGRYRTFPCILRIAGMDLKGTLVVTNYAKSMRATISLCSFAKNLETQVNKAVIGGFNVVTNKQFYPYTGDWVYGSNFGPLPTVYNPKAYGDQDADGGGKNPGYGGLLNWYDSISDDFCKNDMPTTDVENDEGYNVNSRCVFPWMMPVLKECLGGKVTGSFATDSEIHNLVMYSHAMSDSLNTSMPDVTTCNVTPYSQNSSLIFYGLHTQQTSWGYLNGAICSIKKAGYYEVYAEMDTPNGEFSFFGNPAAQKPNDSLNFRPDNGKTILEWKGFLELRAFNGDPFRLIQIQQMAGLPFTTGVFTIKQYDNYRLNTFSNDSPRAEFVLPNITVAEMLTSLAAMFCFTPLVDPCTGNVQLEFMSDILHSKALDVSSYIGADIEIEPQAPAKYKFEFDYPSDGYCNGENFRDIEGRPLIEVKSYFEAPEPTLNAFLLDQSTLSVYSAEENDEGTVVWKFFTDMGGDFVYGSGSEDVPISSKCTPMVNQIVTEPIGSKIMVPACEMEVQSKVFGVNNTDVPFRILHWCGFKHNNVGGKYPLATSGSRDMMGNKIATFDMFWGSENGLVNTFWKPWLEYLDQSEKVTIPLFPTESELQPLIRLFFPQDGEQTRKIYGHDVEMLPAEMVVEFTPDSITGVQIKALRSVAFGKIIDFGKIPTGNPVINNPPSSNDESLVACRFTLKHVNAFSGFVGQVEKVTMVAVWNMPNGYPTEGYSYYQTPAANTSLKIDVENQIECSYSDCDQYDNWFTTTGIAYLDYVTVTVKILAGENVGANVVAGSTTISASKKLNIGTTYEHTIVFTADIGGDKGTVVLLTT